MNAQPHVRWRDETLILQVYVQPRASRNEVTGWHEHGLKIRLEAPPVDGEATQTAHKVSCYTTQSAHIKDQADKRCKWPAKDPGH